MNEIFNTKDYNIIITHSNNNTALYILNIKTQENYQFQYFTNIESKAKEYYNYFVKKLTKEMFTVENHGATIKLIFEYDESDMPTQINNLTAHFIKFPAYEHEINKKRIDDLEKKIVQLNEIVDRLVSSK